MTTNNGAGGLDSLEKIVAEMKGLVDSQLWSDHDVVEWADRIAALQAQGEAVPCKTVIVYGDHGPEEREPVEDYYTAPPSDVLRRVVDALEAIRDAELFADGVDADLPRKATRAEVFALGRDSVFDELASHGIDLNAAHKALAEGEDRV